MAEKKTKKKGFSAFWIGYLVFLFIMIIFWCFVVGNVKKCLVQYEASQPERLIEKIVSDIENGKVGDYFIVTADGSKYEDKDIYRKEYRNRVNGRKITYKKDAASALEAPEYGLYADDDLFGIVTLKEVSKEPLMFILSLSTWAIDETRTVYETGKESVEITVPDIYQVYLNDVALDENAVLIFGEDIPRFRYVKEYVDVPKQVTYQVEGLCAEPEVRICDRNGSDVPFTKEKKDGTLVVATEDFLPTEIPAEIEQMVLENEKLYSNFLTRDVEKSRITSLFPKDSLYLDYRDGWTISKHNTPVFSDENVTNYVEYSEDLFSCDVYMMKSMYIPRTGKTIEQTLHERVYYGRIDGSWKILEMNSLSHEEAEES